MNPVCSPEWSPVLRFLCHLLGCTLQPPKAFDKKYRCLGLTAEILVSLEWRSPSVGVRNTLQVTVMCRQPQLRATVLHEGRLPPGAVLSALPPF